MPNWNNLKEGLKIDKRIKSPHKVYITFNSAYTSGGGGGGNNKGKGGDNDSKALKAQISEAIVT